MGAVSKCQSVPDWKIVTDSVRAPERPSAAAMTHHDTKSPSSKTRVTPRALPSNAARATDSRASSIGSFYRVDLGTDGSGVGASGLRSASTACHDLSRTKQAKEERHDDVERVDVSLAKDVR